jgi:hypothetical protein
MQMSRKVLHTAHVATSLALVLGLAACSRSNTDSLVGPGRELASSHRHGVKPPPPGPPPAAVDPCVSATGFGGAAVVTGSVPQFRTGRVRIELVGDVAAGTIDKLAKCALGNTPAVSFVSGTGSTSRTGALAFSALAVPVPAEAGTVLATDAAGNTLQIIWPAIANGVVGPPILRLQLVDNTRFASGDAISANLSLTFRSPDGTTATITASAANMIVPAFRL